MAVSRADQCPPRDQQVAGLCFFYIDRAALIPQARAGVVSLTESYGAGRASLSSVSDGEMTSLMYESQFVRTLADFAKSLAELEQLVGAEVVQ